MRKHAVCVLIFSMFAAACIQSAPKGGLKEDIKNLSSRLRQHDPAALKEVQSRGLEVKKALVPQLLSVFKNGPWKASRKAASILVEVGKAAPRAVVPVIVRSFEASEPNELSVRLPLVELLRDLGPHSVGALPVLIEALKSADLHIQQQALWAVQSIGPKAGKAVPALMGLLESRDAGIRKDAVNALKCVGVTAEHVPALISALDSKHEAVRDYAAGALGTIGPEAEPAVSRLIKLLKGEDRFLKLKVVKTLRSIGTPAEEAIPVLLEMAEGKSPVVIETIESALKKIKTENAAPTVTDISLSCKEGESIDIEFPVKDKDDVYTALKAYIVSKPAEGVLKRTGPTSFVYHSSLGYVGVLVFTWKGTDGDRKSAIAEGKIKIIPDTAPPRIERVLAVGKDNRVSVIFNEPVTAASGTKVENYSISKGVRVKQAQLKQGAETVLLTTSPLSRGTEYTLSVSNVRDRSAAHNKVKPEATESFKYHVWKREGLVLLLHAEGNAKDESGNKNHGKESGKISYAEGVMGKAFSFPGAGGNRKNAVSFGAVDAMKSAGKFTIAFFFKRLKDRSGDSNHAVSNIMFSQGSDNNNDNLEIGTQGETIELYLDTVDSDENSSCKAPVKNGVWHHLALTYDKDRSKEAQLFLDGKLIKSWSSWQGALDSSQGSPLTIGNTFHSETPFQGLMDEVYVFSRVLKAEEIMALAASR